MTGGDYRYTSRQGSWCGWLRGLGVATAGTGRQGWPLVWLAEQSSCSCCRCVGKWGQPLVPLAKRSNVTVAVVLVGSVAPLPWDRSCFGEVLVLAKLPTGCGRAVVTLGEFWCQLSLPTRCGRLGTALEGCLLGQIHKEMLEPGKL